MPTIDVPGVGNVEKKYVYVGAAGIAGFAGYMYWRSRKNTAAADTTATDPNAVDPNADPTATGAYDPSLNYSATGTDYYGGAPVYQSPVNQTIPVTSDQPITTDAAWDSAAVAAAGDMGADPGALSSALGRFLAGLCLSEAQADLVRQAEGMFGRPPQSQNLQIRICSVTPTPTGSAKTPTGFRVKSTDKSGITLTWSAVTGASNYLLKVTGNGLNHTVTTGNTTYRVGALHHAQTYHFDVRSVVGGVNSPRSATVSGKTK